MEFGQYYKFPDNRRLGDLEGIVEHLPTMRFASIISHWYKGWIRLRSSVTGRGRHLSSPLVAIRSRDQIVAGSPQHASQMYQWSLKTIWYFFIS